MLALVAVEDQETIATHTSGPSRLLEIPNPIHTFHVSFPAVMGNSEYLVG